MSRIEEDPDREYRIDMEVVVDAYDSEERAMGWYYYISDNCEFPFKAKCIEKIRISPLDLDEKVDVLSVASADECEKKIFVEIKWSDRTLAVPLSQLNGIDVSDKTKEVIEDWHYWCQRGYEF